MLHCPALAHGSSQWCSLLPSTRMGGPAGPQCMLWQGPLLGDEKHNRVDGSKPQRKPHNSPASEATPYPPAALRGARAHRRRGRPRQRPASPAGQGSPPPPGAGQPPGNRCWQPGSCCRRPGNARPPGNPFSRGASFLAAAARRNTRLLRQISAAPVTTLNMI